MALAWYWHDVTMTVAYHTWHWHNTECSNSSFTCSWKCGAYPSTWCGSVEEGLKSCNLFPLEGTSWTCLHGCAWTASTWPSTRSPRSCLWTSFCAACRTRACPSTFAPPSAASCCTCMWTGTLRSLWCLFAMPGSGLRSPRRSPFTSMCANVQAHSKLCFQIQSEACGQTSGVQSGLLIL